MTEISGRAACPAPSAGSTGHSSQNPADVIKDFSRQRVMRRALAIPVMVPMDPNFKAAIAAIPEDGWTDRAGWHAARGLVGSIAGKDSGLWPEASRGNTGRSGAGRTVAGPDGSWPWVWR